MLDNLKPPPARLVAQMRAIAQTHKLSDEVADMLAKQPGMTAKRAEALVVGLNFIQERGKQADKPRAMKDFITEIGDREIPEAEITMAAANALIQQQMESAGPEIRESATVGHSWDHGHGLAAKMAEGLASRFSPHVKPEKGREFAGATMGAMAMQWQRAQGMKPFSERDAVRALMVGAPHSNSDFISTVIGASVDLGLSQGYMQHQPEIARASRPIERDDFREWTTVRTGAAETLAPVNEAGEFTYTKFDDEGESGPRPSINGKIFRVTEEAVANDRIDALGNVTSGMIRGAVERVRSGLVSVVVGSGGFGKLMRDSNPIFDAEHGNLADGAVISVTSVGAMITKMRRQKGVGQESLDIRPRFLIVPPELETSARQFVIEFDANELTLINPYASQLEVLVEPGLSDSGRWYIAADPIAADGLCHSFVGSEAPTVETRLGWDTATVDFKVRLDIGFGMLDWRGWTMNPGAGN